MIGDRLMSQPEAGARVSLAPLTGSLAPLTGPLAPPTGSFAPTHLHERMKRSGGGREAG